MVSVIHDVGKYNLREMGEQNIGKHTPDITCRAACWFVYVWAHKDK